MDDWDTPSAQIRKLTEQVERLREKEGYEQMARESKKIPPTISTSSVSGGNAAFLGTFEDKPYVAHLKSMFGGVTTYTVCEPIALLSHLKIYCTKRNVNRVVTTQLSILLKLLHLEGNPKDKASLDDYEGSLFTYHGIEILIIKPLALLVSVPYQKFITSRFISKVVNPSTWNEPTEFRWSMLTEKNIEEYYAQFSFAFAISCDIETFKENLTIRCIGWTAGFIDPRTGVISSQSVVLPLDSMWALAWARRFNLLPAQKIFQNGKYDNSYLLRYNAAPTNWLWDTAHFFHAWYAELPKDLGFLNAFFLRKVVYWKDLAETNDLSEYYRYNAMDTWATFNVWVQQILQAPEWAKRNYLLAFPLVYPCLLAEMTGLERDIPRMVEARKELDETESRMLASLRRMIGVPDFNPGSWQQVQKLLAILGCKDITSTSAKDLAKAKFRHPLINHILSFISVGKEEDADSIRGLRKIRSNYLRLDSDAEKGKDNGSKEFNGRILYAINPHGTDTGRCASRDHHFWCGFQIHNIPVGPEVKQTIRASGDFFLAECDLEQAESRDTAHIAGDSALITAVSGSRDFHSVNCSSFFGLAYATIYDDAAGKTLNKPLRNLAKRVNHGANYNMGPGVLVDTMGLKYIYEARILLKLQSSDPKKIAEYLLGQFHKTYPAIRDKYYASVINEVGVSRRLTSRAFHHTSYNLRKYDAGSYISEGDWTRYCFGDPRKNKQHLNSYVAHCPQSLNARTLNEAFMEVFYEIALPNPLDYRLHAQIHDSILFSYRPGREDLADQTRKCMEIPVTVRDVSGISRTFTVPAALKLGKMDKITGQLKRAIYWSETE
jgi:DNA polymerase I-like protein with 3'-5' exonuclease and polymerase domains